MRGGVIIMRDTVLQDEDDGIEEALLRDAELDANPELGISLEQLVELVRSRRNTEPSTE